MIYFCLSHNTRADIWVFIHDKTCSEKGKKYSKKKTGEEGEGESKVVGKYPNKQIPPPGRTHKRHINVHDEQYHSKLYLSFFFD